MAKIDNYNCEGMCQEECCDAKYTHIIWMTMSGFKFCQLFCEKHYDEMVLQLIDKKIEVEKNGS